MKMNRLLPLLLIIIEGHLTVAAQDTLPASSATEKVAVASEELRVFNYAPDTVTVSFFVPESFENTGENVILDKDDVLAPILERLRLGRLGSAKDSLRILHIGDSHVRGRIFPRTAGQNMVETFGPVIYEDMGVNGATCLTFTHPARLEAIAGKKPDLLILSFGTNECHNKRYNAQIHYNQINELVTLLEKELPDTPILLTTPPGQYESFRRRRQKRTYAINPRTVTAVETIKKYAREHKLAVWDLYNLVGGKESACTNWTKAELMRPDHIHYLPQAYALQGELLFAAILNTYNQYVSH